jgi:hypothetical protein
MTRLYHGTSAELVDVRRRDDAPEQFLWRERLYVVRAVLARWTESGRWWRGAAVSSTDLDDREREWWRVEADSGRLAALSGGRGVYDLCFDWSGGTWSLARVLD